MSINSQQKIDLAIVTTEPFPEGMAATNRILSYAKYLAELKKVVVFIAKPTEQYPLFRNAVPQGKIGALNYQYSLNNTAWPKTRNKLIKLFVLLKSYFLLCTRLLKAKPRTILVYSSCFYLRLLVLAVSKITGSNIFIEENEYPKRLKVKKTGLFTSVYLWVYTKYDGMVVMTNELKSYYGSLNVGRIFVLPMTVDTSRFINTEKTDELAKYGKYFCYVGGNGGMLRDGLMNIITSFKIFRKKHPEYKFLVAGPLDRNSLIYKKLTTLIEETSLKDKVIFLGNISPKAVVQVLLNAQGVVMAPQENFISGGFPTKLGEFLASGRPVIVTNVSELSLYLNEKNSFLVDPGDDKLIADAMKVVALSQEKASDVGKQGKKLAKTCFSIEAFGESFLRFLKLV